MVSAWRITKARHASIAFTGAGARTYGGRWNSPGLAAVYLADSIALAQLEVLMHVPSRTALDGYVLFEVRFEEELVTVLPEGDLPAGWDSPIPGPASQEVGDRWLVEGASLLLRVPSVVVPEQCVYIYDPAHRDAARLTIGDARPVAFDPRLREP